MDNPKYLIFDLDGTLVDSVPDLTVSLNLLRSELDCPPIKQQQVSDMVGDGVGLLVKRALGEELFAPALVDKFMHIYGDHLLDNTKCYPGIDELLNSHSASQMAIVTNKPHKLTLKLLAGLNIIDRFKIIIGGDSYAEKKPHPLPVINALKALGAQPQQAVMIGDHHTDLYSGSKAGTATCFCSYGMGNSDNLTTNFWADQPTDLIKLFPGSSLE